MAKCTPMASIGSDLDDPIPHVIVSSERTHWIPVEDVQQIS
jgi:hypothetical protein